MRIGERHGDGLVTHRDTQICKDTQTHRHKQTTHRDTHYVLPHKHTRTLTQHTCGSWLSTGGDKQGPCSGSLAIGGPSFQRPRKARSRDPVVETQQMPPVLPAPYIPEHHCHHRTSCFPRHISRSGVLKQHRLAVPSWTCDRQGNSV